MRDWLRQSLLYSFSLYILTGFYPGVIIPSALPQLLLTGLVLTGFNLLVKPLVKIFTLGLLAWASQALGLFLTVKFVSGLRVIGFTTAPWQSAGFSIPALPVNLFFSYLLASVLLSLLYKLLDGVLCPD